MTDEERLAEIEARFAAKINTEHFTFARMAAVEACAKDVPWLVAQLRASRKVVEAAKDMCREAVDRDARNLSWITIGTLEDALAALEADDE